MHPARVRREHLYQLTDLPNIGPAGARDLRLLGIETPTQLTGRDPWEMYDTLCLLTCTRHDPCVIDVFISITRFINGEAPRSWWVYTAERKKHVIRMQA